MLVALSFLAGLEGYYDFLQQAQSGGLTKLGINGYEDIDKDEIDSFKNYLHLFHFGFEGDKVTNGWLRQLHRSAGGEGRFLFSPDLFSCSTRRELEKFDINNKLYKKKTDYEKKTFSTGYGLGNRVYTTFYEAFIKTPEPDVVNKCEKLIKRSYDTLTKLYNF